MLKVVKERIALWLYTSDYATSQDVKEVPPTDRLWWVDGGVPCVPEGFGYRSAVCKSPSKPLQHGQCSEGSWIGSMALSWGTHDPRGSMGEFLKTLHTATPAIKFIF